MRGGSRQITTVTATCNAIKVVPTRKREQYNLPVESLDLSSRSLNCLKRADIHKVGEALQYEKSELLKIRNFGEKSLRELLDKFAELGLPIDGNSSENPEQENPEQENPEIEDPKEAESE